MVVGLFESGFCGGRSASAEANLFRERFEARIKNFNVCLSAGDGGACSRVPDLCLK